MTFSSVIEDVAVAGVAAVIVAKHMVYGDDIYPQNDEESTSDEEEEFHFNTHDFPFRDSSATRTNTLYSTVEEESSTQLSVERESREDRRQRGVSRRRSSSRRRGRKSRAPKIPQPGADALPRQARNPLRQSTSGRRRRSSSTDSVPGTIINLNFDAKHLLRTDGPVDEDMLEEYRDETFLATHLRRTDTSIDYCGWASEPSRRNHSLIVLEGREGAERLAEDLETNYFQLGGDKHNRDILSDFEYLMLQYKRVGKAVEEKFKCVSLLKGRIVVGVDNRHNPIVDPFVNHLNGRETMKYMKEKCRF